MLRKFLAIINTFTLVNPVTPGTVQLGRNSKVAVFQKIAAAKKPTLPQI